jgi:hypothetical protein
MVCDFKSLCVRSAGDAWHRLPAAFDHRQNADTICPFHSKPAKTSGSHLPL